MSRTDPPGATLHVNVALLECDSPVTLKETLLLLESLPVHTMRVGQTALAFPADELPIVHQALVEQQRFPTIVGRMPEPEATPSEDD